MARQLTTVFCGAKSVGKTTIIQSYNGNTQGLHMPTQCAADLHVDIEFKGNLYDFTLRDTAGEEQYNSLMPIYFANACLVFFVVDCDKESTFSAIEENLKAANERAAQGFIKVILVNKVDLISDQRKDELIESFQTKYPGWLVFATTYKDLNTIVLAIQNSLKKCADEDKSNPFGTDSKMDISEKKKEKCC